MTLTAIDSCVVILLVLIVLLYFSTPNPCLRLSVNLSEVARGEISLQPWYASGGCIRAVLLENQTNSPF